MRADNKRIKTERHTIKLLLAQCIIDIIIIPRHQEKVKLHL